MLPHICVGDNFVLDGSNFVKAPSGNHLDSVLLFDESPDCFRGGFELSDDWVNLQGLVTIG